MGPHLHGRRISSGCLDDFGAGPGWLPDVFYSIADLATAAVAFGLVAWIALRDARRGNREAYALLFS